MTQISQIPQLSQRRTWQERSDAASRVKVAGGRAAACICEICVICGDLQDGESAVDKLTGQMDTARSAYDEVYVYTMGRGDVIL